MRWKDQPHQKKRLVAPLLQGHQLRMAPSPSCPEQAPLGEPEKPCAITHVGCPPLSGSAVSSSDVSIVTGQGPSVADRARWPPTLVREGSSRGATSHQRRSSTGLAGPVGAAGSGKRIGSGWFLLAQSEDPAPFSTSFTAFNERPSTAPSCGPSSAADLLASRDGPDGSPAGGWAERSSSFASSSNWHGAGIEKTKVRHRCAAGMSLDQLVSRCRFHQADPVPPVPCCLAANPPLPRPQARTLTRRPLTRLREALNEPAPRSQTSAAALRSGSQRLSNDLVSGRPGPALHLRNAGVVLTAVALIRCCPTRAVCDSAIASPSIQGKFCPIRRSSPPAHPVSWCDSLAARPSNQKQGQGRSPGRSKTGPRIGGLGRPVVSQRPKPVTAVVLGLPINACRLGWQACWPNSCQHSDFASTDSQPLAAARVGSAPTLGACRRASGAETVVRVSSGTTASRNQPTLQHQYGTAMPMLLLRCCCHCRFQQGQPCRSVRDRRQLPLSSTMGGHGRCLALAIPWARGEWCKRNGRSDLQVLFDQVP